MYQTGDQQFFAENEGSRLITEESIILESESVFSGDIRTTLPYISRTIKHGNGETLDTNKVWLDYEQIVAVKIVNFQIYVIYFTCAEIIFSGRGANPVPDIHGDRMIRRRGEKSIEFIGTAYGYLVIHNV